MRKMKKALMGIFAATMVMASVLTVAAKTATTTSGAGVEETLEQTSSGESNASPASAPSTSTSTPAPASAKSAGAAISVAGTSVKTTIAGSYSVANVAGIAVTTPIANIRTALGLTAGQTPYVIIYDIDAKTSSKAMASINAAAQALGANVIASMNLELGARQNGKFTPVALKNGGVGMVVGIPEKAVDPAKTYSMVCVQPGGAVTILDDLDTNPKTVTFEAKASLAAYSIVAK